MLETSVLTSAAKSRLLIGGSPFSRSIAIAGAEHIKRPSVLQAVEDALVCALVPIVGSEGAGKSSVVSLVCTEWMRDGRGTIVKIGGAHNFSEAYNSVCEGLSLPGDFSAAEIVALRRNSRSRGSPRLFDRILAGESRDRLLVICDNVEWNHPDGVAIRDLVESLIEIAPHSRVLLTAKCRADLPIASWIAQGRALGPLMDEDLKFSDTEIAELVSGRCGIVDGIDAISNASEGWPLWLGLVPSNRHCNSAAILVHSVETLLDNYFEHGLLAKLSRRETDALTTASFLDNEFDVEEALRGWSLDVNRLIRFGALQEQRTGASRIRPSLTRYLRKRSGRTPRSAHAQIAMGYYTERDNLASALAVADCYGNLSDIHNIVSNDVARATHARFVEYNCAKAENTNLGALGELLQSLSYIREGRAELCNAGLRRALSTGEISIALAVAMHSISNSFVTGGQLGDACGEAIRLLEQMAPAETCSTNELLPALRLAVSEINAGRQVAASIENALIRIERCEDALIRSFGLLLLALAAYYADDFNRARSLTLRARILIQQLGLHVLDARAAFLDASSLQALGGDDDAVAASFAEAHDLSSLPADRLTQAAAAVALKLIDAERGRSIEMPFKIKSPNRLDSGSAIFDAALNSARALQAVNDDDIYCAFQYSMPGSALTVASRAKEARLCAEHGVYAALVGNRDDACNVGDEVEAWVLAHARTRHDTVRDTAITEIMLSLIFTLTGQPRRANPLICLLEQKLHARPARLRILVAAARAFYHRVEFGDTEAFDESCDRLEIQGMTGFARLLRFAGKKTHEPQAGQLSTLTPGELKVLRALVVHGRSALVAESMERSINTVNVHVKSIMRKLDCNSRQQAIAIARSHGL